MTRKIIAAVLVILMVAALFSACSNQTSLDKVKKDGKIIMLTNAGFPPFEYIGDDNKPAGVDVDVANEIAKDLGVSLEIVDMDFDGLINALVSGKGHFVAAGMSVTPDRQKSVDFSIEYVVSSQYIIVPEGSSIASLEDLAGKRIGVQTGTTGDLIVSDEINGWDEDGKHVTGALEGSGATVNQYKTGLEAALDLNNGRLDAVVIDMHPARAIAAANPGLTVSEEPMSDAETYAIAVAKDSPELLEAINNTLTRLMKEGKIEDYLISHTAA